MSKDSMDSQVSEPDGPDAIRWCNRCKQSVPTVEWQLSSTRVSIVHIGLARWCLDADPIPCDYRERIPRKINRG